MNYYIYALTIPGSELAYYVGQTTRPKWRMREHFFSANRERRAFLWQDFTIPEPYQPKESK